VGGGRGSYCFVAYLTTLFVTMCYSVEWVLDSE
jgi:hypothetical protein